MTAMLGIFGFGGALFLCALGTMAWEIHQNKRRLDQQTPTAGHHVSAHG